MKSVRRSPHPLKAFVALSLLAGSAYPQQTTQPATSTASEGDPVVLSPFEVSTDRDRGYQTTDTLAGTRIRTDLKDVGSALSVYTKEFINDIGATDATTLLQYTTNAEVAGTRGTYAGVGNTTTVSETDNLRAPGSAQRVRGLAAADATRDFFVTDIPWDSFNVDRIDIQRGPNSILFGLGSPAGIQNASTRNAEFRNKNEAQFRTGSYGSIRGSLDINQELIKNVLAIRLDGLWSQENYQQKPAYQDDKRYYAAVRFEPQLFKRRDFRTSIKAKYEHGEIDANRPRNLPPNDSITPWFRPVDTTSLNGGMGKLTINNGYEAGASLSSISGWLNGGGIDQQQPAWFIDGATNQLIRIYGGYINTGARNLDGTVRSASESLLGQRYSQPFFGLGGLPTYAGIARLPGFEYGQYRTAVLQDASVFDFYNNLIDGPTKSEFEKWDAYNLDFSQTMFDDRLGVQLTLDNQDYKRGGQTLINPTITIDILRNFQDRPDVASTAAPSNPNFGRAYVLGGPGNGTSYESERKYVRGSLFGELRSTDFFDKDSFLAKLLGKHRFNGVYSDEKYWAETRQWQMYANNLAWDSYWTRTDGTTSGINTRPPVAVIYLGSSLAANSSASGANIPGIQSSVQLANGNLYAFDSTWRNPTGVNFSDPWTIPANLVAMFNPNATPAPNTQVSNPANYIGWNTNYQMNLMRYNGGEDLSLLRNSAKTLRTTKSYAGSWQGFLWNGAVVPTLGWRFDTVKGKAVTAIPVSNNRNILNLNDTGAASTRPYVFPDGPDSLQSNQSYSLFKDHSTSGGVVVHLNKLFERDPLPINISLSYNKSSNFQVTDTRRDIYGKVISNPTGATKDYGVLLSTKDGKYSFRAVKYETKIENSNTTLDASGLTGTIKNGLNWRNIMLYRLSGYVWDTREQANIRHEWTPVYVNAAGRAVAPASAANPPAGSTLQTQAQAIAMRDATITAWNDIQKFLETKGYFAAWNYTPTTASALTTRSAYEANGLSPNPTPSTVVDYRSAPNLQGFQVTADTESKGYEFELTANPTRNWRIIFNAAETTAIRTNVGGAELSELVDFITDKINGAAGDMRMFNANFDDPTNVIWNNGTWTGFRSGYTLMKLQEGAAASEIRKWRYNIVTNYSFSNGGLKGFGVGAGYRWQDKVIIGYPVIPGTGGIASFDLSKPYYGPSEDAADAWISYERKLTRRIGWKIQLNGRNLFGKEELIPISIQPDGKTWAAARIAPNREWFVTNTLTF